MDEDIENESVDQPQPKIIGLMSGCGFLSGLYGYENYEEDECEDE